MTEQNATLFPQADPETRGPSANPSCRAFAVLIAVTLVQLFLAGIMLAWAQVASRLDIWLSVETRVIVPAAVALAVSAIGLLAGRPAARYLAIAANGLTLVVLVLHGLAMSIVGIVVIPITASVLVALLRIRPIRTSGTIGPWEVSALIASVVGLGAVPLLDPLPNRPATVLAADGVSVWTEEDAQLARDGQIRLSGQGTPIDIAAIMFSTRGAGDAPAPTRLAPGSIVIAGSLASGQAWFLPVAFSDDPNRGACLWIYGPGWADGDAVVIQVFHRLSDTSTYGLRLPVDRTFPGTSHPFGQERFLGSFCVDEGAHLIRYQEPFLFGY